MMAMTIQHLLTMTINDQNDDNMGYNYKDEGNNNNNNNNERVKIIAIDLVEDNFHHVSGPTHKINDNQGNKRKHCYYSNFYKYIKNVPVFQILIEENYAKSKMHY